MRIFALQGWNGERLTFKLNVERLTTNGDDSYFAFAPVGREYND